VEALDGTRDAATEPCRSGAHLSSSEGRDDSDGGPKLSDLRSLPGLWDRIRSSAQSTPLESMVLAEVMCLRMILLNLFANLGLPTATLHFVMRNANSVKHSEVARVLRETKEDLDSSTHARGTQETP
jgi:hypothetical protein